jgi:hypothetical protein
LSDFNETWIFSTVFEKYANTSFVKIRSLAVELFHADRRKDGRTDGQTGRYVDTKDKVNIFFRNFADVPSAEFEHAISEIQWLQI